MAAPLNEALVLDAVRPLSANLNDSSGSAAARRGRSSCVGPGSAICGHWPRHSRRHSNVCFDVVSGLSDAGRERVLVVVRVATSRREVFAIRLRSDGDYSH